MRRFLQQLLPKALPRIRYFGGLPIAGVDNCSHFAEHYYIKDRIHQPSLTTLRSRIARMYAEAFPDAKLELKRVYTCGETAVAELVARGTHEGELLGIVPTGKTIEISICNIIELRDGKIYREREYMDMMQIMVQLGQIKPLL